MKRVPCRVFTAEYKSEAVKLAGAVGVPTAARQLDIASPREPDYPRCAMCPTLENSRQAGVLIG